MEHPFTWPQQFEGAVSLTYDDALPIHHTLVDPLLRQHGLRATFYAPIKSDLGQHPERWRQLAAAGHELGNHTLFHPCRQTYPVPHAWLDERYDLGRYTVPHMRDELEVANLVLQLLDGHTERSFGNTCCDTTVGPDGQAQPLEPLLAKLFVAARGALTDQIARPARGLDLLNVGCIAADGRSFADLTDIVEQARADGGWAVLMIHGVGPDTHDLHMDAANHERLISWLGQQPTLWTAPVRTVARHIRQQARGAQ